MVDAALRVCYDAVLNVGFSFVIMYINVFVKIQQSSLCVVYKMNFSVLTSSS